MIFTILILIQLIIAALILKQAKNTKILWIIFFIIGIINIIHSIIY